MRSLFDLDFGTDAIVRRDASDSIRRTRHSDLSVAFRSEDEVALVLNLTRSHRVEGTLAGVLTSDRPAVGTVTVVPPHHAARFAITGTCSVVILRLPWSTVLAAVEDAGRDPRSIVVAPRVNVTDRRLARSIYAAVVADPRELGPELVTVAAHLPFAPANGHDHLLRVLHRGGLTAFRLRRVLDRIETELGGALPLVELADVAGMSPFHFARAFARTTGVPPHVYITRRRVDVAMERLASPDLSVAEVARSAGFSHASHLARAMRGVTGLSATLFRRSVLP